MTLRLLVRVFIAGVKQYEERVDVRPGTIHRLLPSLALKHAAAMAFMPGMVEIEFLDEPDVDKRFFRMGTDKSAMVKPIAVDLNNPEWWERYEKAK